MIHFHGTPISPRSELMKMAGKHFCVSFADARDGDWCLQNAQSVMWDNGRFTAFTQGKAVDDAKLYAWLEPRLGHPHWAVIPDVIDGSVEDQRRLVAEWPFDLWLGAPVWHMGLPIDYLLELADQWPRMCFGSSGRYWQVGSSDWERRADEAFNALAKRGPLPWIHMLRGLALAGDRWPFASADSTNVARNFKNVGSEVDPERMARRIDSVQCPINWATRPEQQDMFAA
ncbi:hypothetical protein [Mesorhizobium sp. M4B.F.Ca.ET.143.01.1.1]|uniref:hypothetical protein n=1 Tax=Mesorhizobium sp. M4B.F.Ca.ET.143.01.1.1 TaxID=2563947 RepID=UPI001093909F|nr:hypothetical protein [Mesorhizobium sp. M4B.F.Ca.ET.143.01.1.1]TGV26369.1 hypothetical protein EN786_12675 [Mesorhizobium sp. M4B.F.Ca.ET.143.01.1.1]